MLTVTSGRASPSILAEIVGQYGDSRVPACFSIEPQLIRSYGSAIMHEVVTFKVCLLLRTLPSLTIQPAIVACSSLVTCKLHPIAACLPRSPTQMRLLGEVVVGLNSLRSSQSWRVLLITPLHSFSKALICLSAVALVIARFGWSCIGLV